MTNAAAMRRWPLVLIAAPAAVAIWSGWVGLGALCGFGPVRPLPGIDGSLTINTAITLPVGVEAYGAYALKAWLTPGTGKRAQEFARASAIGALVLGMCGQVIYHLLSAAHATKAPWPVTVAVSCMPVITLGFGAAMTHLLRAGHGDAADGTAGVAARLAGDDGTAAQVAPRPREEAPGSGRGPATMDGAGGATISGDGGGVAGMAAGGREGQVLAFAPYPGNGGGGPSGRRGETRRVMRAHWDRETAAGRVPNGADLNRAAGREPDYSLGKRYAQQWRREITAERRVEPSRESRGETPGEITAEWRGDAVAGVLAGERGR